MTALEIKKRMGKDFDINIKTISRKRNFTYPRAIFFKLCRDFTEMGTQDLADMLNLKCHATVLNAINNTFYDAMYEIKYKNYYDKLKRELGNEPCIERENAELRVKVAELEEILSFYRKRAEEYGLFR